jgi:hypothetical protein
MKNPNHSLDIQCANCKHVIVEQTDNSFCKSCDDETVNEPAPRYGFTKDGVYTDLNGLQNENS